MKKLFILLSMGLYFASAVCADETKTTSAVMDLQAQEGVSQGVSNVLSDCLRTYLVNTGKFTIVTRENMEQILKEQNFQMSGCTSQECVVQMGQLLGVRKMFTGSIGKVGATYVINLKIIDMQSGKIERAEKEECPKCEEDALLVSIKNIADKIVGLEQNMGQKSESTHEEVTKLSPEIDPHGLIKYKAFFPNPFSPNNDGKCNSATLYIFSVKGEPVTVRIYNIKGNLIRTLVEKKIYYDTAQISWDGTDENNEPSPAGIYLYQLKVGDKSTTGKIVLSK